MKVNVIKDHTNYEKGIQDVSEERASYLIAMGVAEAVEEGLAEEKKPEEKMIEPVIENKLSPVKPKNKSSKKKQ